MKVHLVFCPFLNPYFFWKNKDHKFKFIFPKWYKTTSPRKYKEQEGKNFHQFKVLLNDHLKGERGNSTLALLFETNVQDFNPQAVKMGLTPACPMSLRREIIAQHNYRANENRRLNSQNPATNESIRVTNLMAATLGMALSLTYRLIRAVLRTALAIITVPYALHQGQRYKIKGWEKEDLKRIGWEWIDVGTTLASLFAGIVNTFHPNAIKLDSLRDYYVSRIDEAIQRNQEFATAKQEYLLLRARTKNAEQN
ncbi:MAG: hypothetical protein JJU12_01050 [Chlamydiales bacterium]|nr:hypothetical protein [Chlamydiales bacterium]